MQYPKRARDGDFSIMYLAASTNRRLNFRDGFWLCLAIVVHALLLLIPAAPDSSPNPATDAVVVTLLSTNAYEQPLTETVETPVSEVPAPDPQSAPPAPNEPPEIALQEDPGEKVPADPVPIISTARLLDSARHVKWVSSQPDEPLHLGVYSPRPLPANWTSGMVTEDNLFDGMVVPRKTEIVDRWLAADGSHNVVIHTPGGDTFCGRALAWDPMQPLVEHVMQFRPCGGGGKRTFDMPRRSALPTDIIQVANSTTN